MYMNCNFSLVKFFGYTVLESRCDVLIKVVSSMILLMNYIDLFSICYLYTRACVVRQYKVVC